MRSSVLLLTSSVLLALPLTALGTLDRPPQFVSLAFDGSKSINMWEQTRAFAKEEGIGFTYFISGVYFVTNSDKKIYVEPAKGAGRSAIGFGASADDVSVRLAQVHAAINEGHEIASHANGHYNGAGYSYNQWLSELSQFTDIMSKSYQRYSSDSEPTHWQSFIKTGVTGFRAPQLGHNKGMFSALKATGHTYDTSKIARMDYWPMKENGIWNFPLAGLRMAFSGKKTASMDYNLYVAQSGAKATNAGNLDHFEEEVYQTYLKYFKNNYLGNRAPIDIGHHFSLWNNGIYWKAMKRFAKTVCHLPEVFCGTYHELTMFLESKTSAELRDYQNGNFQKLSASEVNLPPSLLKATLVDGGELSDTELKELQSCTPEAHIDDNGEAYMDI